MGVNCSFCRGPKDNGQHDVDLKEVREVSSNSSRGSEEDLEDADVDEEAMETPSADKRSQQTFMLMNQNITEEVQKCSNVTGGEGDPGRQHATSTTASLGVQHMAIIKQFIEAPITGEPRQLKELLLATIEKLVDKNYDLLPAQMLLEELKGMLGEDEWKDILESPLFGRFSRKVEYFYLIGQVVHQDECSWFSLYSDNKQGHFLHGRLDENDAKVFHYRVSCVIPCRLTQVMAVANEVELMQLWNPMVVKTPDVIGRRTGHYMVTNYQMSVMGGLYKIDLLNEIRRFSDVNKGFLAEYIMSADSSHPCYRTPPAGYKRPQTELRNIWVVTGPNKTQLFQFGKLKLPFNATKFFAKRVGAFAGPFFIDGLV